MAVAVASPTIVRESVPAFAGETRFIHECVVVVIMCREQDHKNCCQTTSTTWTSVYGIFIYTLPSVRSVYEMCAHCQRHYYVRVRLHVSLEKFVLWGVWQRKKQKQMHETERRDAAKTIFCKRDADGGMCTARVCVCEHVKRIICIYCGTCATYTSIYNDRTHTRSQIRNWSEMAKVEKL